MENVFSEIRNDKMKVNSNLVDVLFRCLDALETYVENIRNNQDEGTDDNEPIIKELNDFLAAGGAAADTSAVQGAPTEIKLADFEKNAINEALNKGMHVYMIHVFVDPNCILKAARAFLVFKNLEGHGDIIKSEPSVQDIEDERFELDFKIVVISSESANSITSIIKDVSEIKDAQLVEITEPFADKSNAVSEEVKEETNAEETTAVEKKPSDNKKAPASSGKPAVKQVGRSVRVDIEKLDVLMNLVSELIIAKNGLVSASDTEEGKNGQNFREQIEYRN